MRDFTLGKYEELLRAVQQKYTFCTVYEYLSQQSGRNRAILRHDVDRKVKNALFMAELEHRLGIHATYYFRYPFTFDKEIMQKIHRLGHEIGYHYEVLSKTRGDDHKAILLFEQELKEFEKICEIHTISMHGSPLSKFDNRDLWKNFRFEDFGIFGEAYLSLKDMTYFSDTGRNWAGEYNMRDHLSQSHPSSGCSSTDDLIRTLQTNNYSRLYLSVHPQRWGTSSLAWILEYCTDLVLNSGKKIITVIRR